MATVALSKIEDYTTGLDRKTLIDRLTWDSLVALGQGRRQMVTEDCKRHDIEVQVKLDPAMLALVPEPSASPDSLEVRIGQRRKTITDKWQDLDIDLAVSLWHDSREQQRYGSPWREDVYRTVQLPSGDVASVLMSESHSLPYDEEGNQMTLFQFRFKHEGALKIARR